MPAGTLENKVTIAQVQIAPRAQTAPRVRIIPNISKIKNSAIYFSLSLTGMMCGFWSAVIVTGLAGIAYNLGFQHNFPPEVYYVTTSMGSVSGGVLGIYSAREVIRTQT